ncbi:MAG TPA: thioesterase family protein [Gammaproteobacteria bacterium]
MTALAGGLLADYPVVIALPVAWGEMDAFGHVNNIVYFRYFESARMAYLERVGLREAQAASGIGPILAETRCRFRQPLDYPDTVDVGARVTRLASDRFVMHYAVASRRHGRLAAEGEGTLVSYDYRANRKAPLPEPVAAAIRALEGARLGRDGADACNGVAG